MPSDTIKCPNCRLDIQLSAAVSQEIREQLRAEFDAEQQKREGLLIARRAQLDEQQKAVEQRSLAVEREIATKLEVAQADLEARTLTKLQTRFEVEMRELRATLAEKDRRLTAAQQAELDLRRQQHELEQKQAALELEVVRRLDQERSRIREEAKRLALEEQRFRLGEKEKIISDLQKQIEALRQKAEQGSQQLQGEVLELEFERLLQTHFPADEITGVDTGVRGADLLQRVRDGAGQDCGRMIWEAKRTRHWNSAWTAKLKEDQRAICADMAILLTVALPAGIKNFGLVDGVWVTEFGCGLGLAAALRQGLINAANARRVEEGRKEKTEVLYQYLSGTEFRQKVEAVVEAFVSMKADLDAEKRALTNLWAKREKRIEQAVVNMALMYGGVQGIVGQAALPAIRLLELES